MKRAAEERGERKTSYPPSRSTASCCAVVLRVHRASNKKAKRCRLYDTIQTNALRTVYYNNSTAIVVAVVLRVWRLLVRFVFLRQSNPIDTKGERQLESSKRKKEMGETKHVFTSI